ncbi:site-2 protease family protein [Temperatibacter marinus]|uniref:Site-2 protease family protein n=1 Tax=Temperatibacter marinus TaxID=1456591 RepID=A0AA52EGC7_9PROT|nr:site-2 protease family protein [Temperatibacter marinus]WND02628.1 site-2 protease family protein [Temperatibacter marinus]
MDASVATMINMITTMALPFLFAITVPVIVQAYVADRMGDVTPRLEGRLSADPLRHVDPFGTVLMPLLSVVMQFPILLGWPKALNVNPGNFRHPQAMKIYALCGFLALLMLALIMGILLKWTLPMTGGQGWLFENLKNGMLICCVFAVLKMLPIPPNDGALFIAQFLPPKHAESYFSVAPYGFFIFLAVILFFKEIIFVPAISIYIALLTLLGA